MAGPVSDLRRLAWRAVAALPGPVRELAYLPVRLRADAELRRLTPMPPAARRLYLGPRNTAGAAWEWARAVERHLPDTAAQCLVAESSTGAAPLHTRADHVISVRAQRGRVREIHGGRVLREATHVLLESGAPVLSDFRTGSILDDLPALREAGIRSAALYHGSELRDLRQHAERYEHSPFRAEWDDYFRTLQAVVDRKQAELADVDVPLLVPTPDMLDVLPQATWLPLVVDVDRFTTAVPALERRRPVVLHAPSNPRLKGTAVVEEVLTGMQQRGLVEYRRLAGVPHTEIARFVADADVVVDQVVLGNPATLAAETWAAGRLLVAHLPDRVRERMTAADPGGAPVPALEADAGSFAEVMAEVAAHPERFRELAAGGPGFARRNHDGRRSAQVLESVLLSQEWPARGSGAPGA